MKILLYGLNYAPEQTGIGKYSGEMGAWLAKRGHQVKTVSSVPYYPAWSIDKQFRNWFSKQILEDVEVYRCPLYVPEKPTTLRRLIHLWSFVFSSIMVLLFLLRWRPTVMINVVPTMFTTIPAWLYCKLTGAKLVLHVQDFEGDAMFSLDMSVKGFLPSIWIKFERFVLSKANRLSTISNAMLKNATNKGVTEDKLLLFPNWSETQRFSDVKVDHEFRQSLGLPADKKIILYSGNIGRKQGLDMLLRAAWLCRDQDDWLFVIVGDGAAKQDLLEQAEELTVDNLKFLPLQPYEKLPQLLSLADVHLVIQNPGVADAVLPSKLTNILAVGGNAVITTTDDTEMGHLIEHYPGVAIKVLPENEKKLIDGIREALSQPLPNQVAKQYAQSMLDKESVLSAFETQLLLLSTKMAKN